MTRKYKLERLQKHILLGFSSVTLASTIFLGGTQAGPDEQLSQDISIVQTDRVSANEEIKILNKAEKENLKSLQQHSKL